MLKSFRLSGTTSAGLPKDPGSILRQGSGHWEAGFLKSCRARQILRNAVLALSCRVVGKLFLGITSGLPVTWDGLDSQFLEVRFCQSYLAAVPPRYRS